MPQQGFIDPNNNTAGVDTSDTAKYLTSPAGNNKLPSNYQPRGNNKPLAVLETVTRGGRTVTNKSYNEIAFGKETSGTIKTENPYKNNYKRSQGGKFDSRYPSIWRAPKGINYVRGLDEWEKAALDAALGRTWTPTTGPGTGSTPPAAAPPSAPPATPPPAAPPATPPAAAPAAPPSTPPAIRIYGPISSTFSGGGKRRIRGGAASQSLNVYIVTEDNKSNRYFNIDSSYNISELTVESDNLVFNGVSAALGNFEIESTTEITAGNIYDIIMNYLTNGPPDSSPPDSSPPDSSPPDSSPPDSSPPDSSPPDSSAPPPSEDGPPPDGPQITIYGGYETTFTPLSDMNNGTNPFTSYIYLVPSDGNVNRYFFMDPNDPDQNIIELSNEDTNGYLLYNNKYITSQTKNDLDNLVVENPIELTDGVDSITYNKISIAAAPQVGVGGRKQKNKSRRFRKHFRKTRKSFKE